MVIEQGINRLDVGLESAASRFETFEEGRKGADFGGNVGEASDFDCRELFTKTLE